MAHVSHSTSHCHIATAFHFFSVKRGPLEPLGALGDLALEGPFSELLGSRDAEGASDGGSTSISVVEDISNLKSARFNKELQLLTQH